MLNAFDVTEIAVHNAEVARRAADLAAWEEHTEPGPHIDVMDAETVDFEEIDFNQLVDPDSIDWQTEQAMLDDEIDWKCNLDWDD